MVDEDLEFLVLASDGLWDVVPNEVRSAFSINIYRVLLAIFSSSAKFRELVIGHTSLHILIPLLVYNCFVNPKVSINKA